MAGPVLDCPATSDTGAYRIAWEGPAGATYRLVESGPAGGTRTLYRGAERASTVSGRQAGRHSYRVAVVDGGRAEQWSRPCVVDVRPPSMGLALGLFAVGLLVCVATIIVIVRGHRAHQRGEIG